jgi:hypothetical protein
VEGLGCCIGCCILLILGQWPHLSLKMCLSWLHTVSANKWFPYWVMYHSPCWIFGFHPVQESTIGFLSFINIPGNTYQFTSTKDTARSSKRRLSWISWATTYAVKMCGTQKVWLQHFLKLQFEAMSVEFKIRIVHTKDFKYQRTLK